MELEELLKQPFMRLRNRSRFLYWGTGKWIVEDIRKCAYVYWGHSIEEALKVLLEGERKGE